MHCWACQREFERDDAVVIDGQPISVCRPCWESIPAAQRIALAQKIKSAPAAEAAFRAFQQLVDRHMLEGDSPDWLPRRG